MMLLWLSGKSGNKPKCFQLLLAHIRAFYINNVLLQFSIRYTYMFFLWFRHHLETYSSQSIWIHHINCLKMWINIVCSTIFCLWALKCSFWNTVLASSSSSFLLCFECGCLVWPRISTYQFQHGSSKPGFSILLRTSVKKKQRDGGILRTRFTEGQEQAMQMENVGKKEKQEEAQNNYAMFGK